FISNEGGFNAGNASVSYYDFATKNIRNKIFQDANARSLGDVLQSMAILEQKAYLVLNNSNKIEVVNVEDFTVQNTISPFVAPRYLLPVSPQKAYVSDLYADWIFVLDLQSNTKVDSIYFKGWSEEMLLHDGKVFVTNPSFYDQAATDKVYVIDVANDQLVDSISVGKSPLSIQKDKNDKLWVLCEGHQNTGNFGGLYQIDPTSLSVEKTFPFTNFTVSNRQVLSINPTKDTLYYLRKDIFCLPIATTDFTPTNLISAAGRDLYGMRVDPNSGNIWIGESGFFQQQGKAFLYNRMGTLQKEITAGVGINNFYFY
ncbi:MAG: DUF5074 domain-containing protein, partial [Saprospiraceae bacterium]